MHLQYHKTPKPQNPIMTIDERIVEINLKSKKMEVSRIGSELKFVEINGVTLNLEER